MKKFLIGVAGAAVFATIAWLIIYNVLNIESEMLQYAIAGIVTFAGFTVAQGIYTGVTKKGKTN